MFLLSAAVLAGLQTVEPIAIHISGRQIEDCEMRWKGQLLSDDDMRELEPEWRREGRVIILRASGHTLYGCVMRAMGRLERAELTVRLEAESPR